MRDARAGLIAFVLLSVSGCLGLWLSLYMHPDTIDVNAVQSVQVFHFPALFVKQLAHDPNAGKKIYKEFCVSCHAKNPIIAVKAPHVGNAKEWQRFIKGKQLLQHTIQGAGAMPARGGCFECSDAQLRMTIDYMLQS